jgi:hypothetical protein
MNRNAIFFNEEKRTDQFGVNAMNTLNLRSCVRITVKSRRVALGIGVLAIGGYVVASLLRAQEGAPLVRPSQAEMDAALASTIAVVLTNAACPTSPVEVLKVASGYLPVLHPELTARERLADPAAVRADAAAAWPMLNPGAYHTERLKDPDYRRRDEQIAAAIAGMNRPARDGSGN